MPKVRLLLRSSRIKDALSSLLTEAGFSISLEPGLTDDDTKVVIDFSDGPDRGGIRARQRPGAKIVVLTNEAGRSAMSGDQIAPLDAGERALPRNLAPARCQSARPTENDLRAGGEPLSPREWEVLLQVIEGRPNQVIARHLHICEGAVKIHLESLQRKIKVDNRTQAAIWAVKHLPGLANPAADTA
jgi:DNA-binding NarL/FixJ family response regulator